MGAERGILMTGMCGGLVSSPVVALSVARRAAGGLAQNLLAASIAMITASGAGWLIAMHFA